MKTVIVLNKPEGATPYQMVEKIKSGPLYKHEKIGFAGRLDPMAKGLMLFLVGEENKKRKVYEKLTKTYEFEVLFGVSTDSYDILGVPTLHPFKKISETALRKNAQGLKGRQIQAYPPYSYPRIKGHPLYWWARRGQLSEITIPEKEIEIYSSEFLDMHYINFISLNANISGRIAKVHGDFRQEEILKAWRLLTAKDPARECVVAKFRITCSSGTYIRALANKMGQTGSGALAFSITRTQVGTFQLKQVI